MILILILDNLKKTFCNHNSIDVDDDENEEMTSVDCKYYTVNDFIKNIDYNNKAFLALHLNTASLTKHIDELRSLLNDVHNPFDMIGITKTKFQKDLPSYAIVTIPSDHIEHTLTESGAGGTLLYIYQIIYLLNLGRISQKNFIHLRNLSQHLLK